MSFPLYEAFFDYQFGVRQPYIWWDTIVPFRQWYKELEDVTKVYRYEYWEQVEVLWFFKWVTDWYTDNKEIYGWQSLEVYGDNIFGWVFKHSQDIYSIFRVGCYLCLIMNCEYKNLSIR